MLGSAAVTIKLVKEVDGGALLFLNAEVERRPILMDVREVLTDVQLILLKATSVEEAGVNISPLSPLR